MYRRLKNIFAWKGMKKQVQHFVQTCQVCLKAKPDRAAYPGKLQPLPTPHEAWHTVSLDFIECLQKSGNSNCILVVVDKFTRYGHVISLSHPYTASSVAMVFRNEIYKLHGMPAAIISDRDPDFTSKFWQHLCKMAGIELRMSSPHHPL
jgi:transposase InsO family protein